MKSSMRIFVALDTTDLERALELASQLKGHVGGVKVGKEFFTALGPEGVNAISALGLRVFLDLKFHDIPNTVAGAVTAALALKPFMLNVHASGGAAMMRAAADAAGNGPDRPWVLAVTVLTSLGDEDLAATGISGDAAAQVLRLAELAQQSGLDGVVCSALEVKTLRARMGDDFKLVVPGIRPEWADWAAGDDQKRITTPSQAIELGADYLVIGRPITAAPDPAEAARRIADELGG